MAAPAATERCIHEALLGAVSGSGTDTDAGAEPGEMEAGLQMDEAAGVLSDGAAATAGFPPRPAAAAGMAEALDAELEDEAELDTAGGVNWPLLSEPELSRTGDDFFLTGRLLVPLPLCCCCRHLARRFLNQTCSGPGEGEQVSGESGVTAPPPLGPFTPPRLSRPSPTQPPPLPVSRQPALPLPHSPFPPPAPSPRRLRKPLLSWLRSRDAHLPTLSATLPEGGTFASVQPVQPSLNCSCWLFLYSPAFVWKACFVRTELGKLRGGTEPQNAGQPPSLGLGPRRFH